MKPENQVTSLEVSQELDKRGVKLGSYFFHAEFQDREYPEIERRVVNSDEYVTLYMLEAPTATELMAVLPRWTSFMRHNRREFMCFDSTEPDVPKFVADSAADSFAKMLLWLIDNGHLTVEQVNGAAE